MREFLRPLLRNPFAIMNSIGLVAFALVESSKAIREEFDLFGITVVGLTTAFVGGATWDVLVNRISLALSSMGEISLGMIGVALAIGWHLVLGFPDDHLITVLSDAVGLAAFTTAGAIVAVDNGVSSFGVVAIATINAVGGGAFADILSERSPFILVTDFYASCAVLGGCTYWLVVIVLGAGSVAAALCAIVTVGTRLYAVQFGLYLPTVHQCGVWGAVR